VSGPEASEHGDAELNAITFVTADMAASVAFWQTAGFPLAYGGPEAEFTSLKVGSNFVNLTTMESAAGGFWGRIIIHVPSPDETHGRLVAAGYEPAAEPRDAPWGERYFHVLAPSGNEISFARKL